MLELKDINFQVDEDAKDKEILKHIDLTIEDGFVAITGPNGGGKSTLAKVIAGVIKPTSGRIIFDGTDITDMTITERAQAGISFAFQQPVRFKGLRVRDLLELAAGRKKGKEGTEAFYQACRTLNAVGLDAKEYIGRELNDTLSGGEMKRIEIAMAAARGTALTLFDEPEAGIDLWSFQSLIQVFEKLYRQTSGTIMIISHQERILNIADKIIYLKDGEVLEYDEGRKVMQHLAEDIQPVPDMGAAAQ
jgi:Fe-S cluster assembly ATP-binding protein